MADGFVPKGAKKVFTPKGAEKVDKSTLDAIDQFLGRTTEIAGSRLFPQAGIGEQVAEAALPAAGAIIPGGQIPTERFLKDPKARAAMGIGAGLLQAPGATIGGLTAGTIGTSLAPEGRKNIAGFGAGLVGAGIGGATEMAVRAALAKSAGGVINSLIKPKAKVFQYGKNPGKEVADQGIVGNSFEQLRKNIDTKIEILNTQAMNLAAKSKTSVDLHPALAPIHRALDKLRQNPKTNAAAITKLENFLDDIIGITRNAKGQILTKRPLGKLGATQAVEIKQGIGRIAKFTGADDPPAFQAVVHQVYHSMRTQIEKAIPGTAKLNASIANLIGASKAIPGAIARAEKAPLGGLISLRSLIPAGGGFLGGGPVGAGIGFGVGKAAEIPGTATRAASLFSKIGKGGLIRGLKGR